MFPVVVLEVVVVRVAACRMAGHAGTVRTRHAAVEGRPLSVEVVPSTRLALGAGHPAKRVHVRVELVQVPVVIVRHFTQRRRLRTRHLCL